MFLTLSVQNRRLWLSHQCTTFAGLGRYTAPVPESALSVRDCSSGELVLVKPLYQLFE